MKLGTKISLMVAALLIAGVLGYGCYGRGRAAQKKWQTASVTRSSLTAMVTATGAVQPIVTSPVGSQVSGIVWRLHADFNSHVRAGQILVELDPALFKNAVAQAEAQLVTAQANELKARATLGDTLRIRDRNRELAREHFVSQSEADTAEANYQGAEAAVRGARAAVIQARAALEKARLDHDHSVIRAPVTGTVISRNVDVGQAVAASFTAPTLFTIAQDLRKMQVHAAIDEADIGQVRVGELATFTVDAFRGEKFKATVSQVRNAAQTIQNVVTYDVVMDVDNPDFKLRPGMTANVRIVSAVKNDVLTLPNSALRFKPPAEGKPSAPPGVIVAASRKGEEGSAVYVPEGEGTRRMLVETGITDGTFTEVRNLPEGTEVIVDMLKNKDGHGGGSGGPPGGMRGPTRGF